MKLFVGTYTGNGSEGIYQIQFDPKTGDLSNKKLAARAESPSYVSVSGDQQHLYSVGEGNPALALVYNIEGDTLVLVDKTTSNGRGACYIDVADANNLVAVANYSSGNVTFLGIQPLTGAFNGKSTSYQHEGSGPDTTRQEGPHAHCSVFSPDGKYVYVVDLGIDKVMGYPIQNGDVGDGFVAIQMQPGDGPRHLVVDPATSRAYLINELSNKVSSLEINPENGRMKEIDRSSTLPADFTDYSKSADIHVTSDGRYLYTSNRGHNSIAIFSVSPAGELARIGLEPVQGEWPRNFALSPDERFLLVANRYTNNITVFERNAETGLLTFTGNEIGVSEPVCLKFQ